MTRRRDAWLGRSGLAVAVLLMPGCAGAPSPAAAPDRAALLPAPVPHEAYAPASPARTQLTPTTLRSYRPKPVKLLISGTSEMRFSAL